MSRIRGLLLAIAVVITNLAFGPTPASAAYYNPCYVGNNEHEYLDKSDVSNMQGGRATSVYLRFTHTCGSAGTSWVLPVNLQGAGICGAQVAWGAIGTQSGNSWYYTHTDSDCVLHSDTGWPVPVSGHLYSLSIYLDTSHCTGWTYEMTDLSAGGTHRKCGTRHVSSVSELWSGSEVYDTNDQMGGAGVNVSTTGIAYRTGSSAWNSFTTSTVIKNVGGHANTYWLTTAELDGGGHSILYSRTNDH